MVLVGVGISLVSAIGHGRVADRPRGVGPRWCCVAPRGMAHCACRTDLHRGRPCRRGRGRRAWSGGQDTGDVSPRQGAPSTPQVTPRGHNCRWPLGGGINGQGRIRTQTAERRGRSVAGMTHISVEGRTFTVSESVEAVTRALGNDGRGVFKDADHPEESIVIDLAGLGWARVSEEPRHSPAEAPRAVSTG